MRKYFGFIFLFLILFPFNYANVSRSAGRTCETLRQEIVDLKIKIPSKETTKKSMKDQLDKKSNRFQVVHKRLSEIGKRRREIENNGHREKEKKRLRKQIQDLKVKNNSIEKREIPTAQKKADRICSVNRQKSLRNIFIKRGMTPAEAEQKAQEMCNGKKQVIKDLRKEIQANEKKIQELADQLGQINEELGALVHEEIKLTKEKKQLIKDMKKLNDEISKLAIDIPKLKRQLKSKEKDFAKFCGTSKK